MTENDYSTISLKCGLEVHQQLDTGKLFCRCPGKLHEEPNCDYKIERRLRPVASELGELDIAALDAFQKGLTYEYECYFDTNCLVCTDDDPPKPANEKAVETVLQIALLTNSAVVPLAIPMRKTVIDGSNVSGFQRTALFATNGALQLPSGKTIGIQSLALEEDAARPMKKTPHQTTYRLDRLGIPLIELATNASITTPQEAKETALAIGELFRRTGNARRGLGSIRQDLNISIAGGARIEIKGVQELELIDEFVRREIHRQQKLLELKQQLSEKKISKKELEQAGVYCSHVFLNSECKFLKGQNVLGLRIPKFKGLFGFEVQPNRRFGTEVANYVKTKTGLQGILHSDELPNYGVSVAEINEVQKLLNCTETDAFVLVSGETERAQKALDTVIARCQQALEGVPEETRQALVGGNTEYLRPLAGGARMYPETDLAAIENTVEKIAEIKKRLPLTPAERVKLYTSKGVSSQLAENMKLDNWAVFFEEQLKKGINASFAAWVLLEALTQLQREKIPIENLTRLQLEQFFDAHKKGKITKETALDTLRSWSKTPFESLETILKQSKTTTISDSDSEKIIEQIVLNNSELVKSKQLAAVGPLMGDVMKQLRGKITGEKAAELLKAAIQKQLGKNQP